MFHPKRCKSSISQKLMQKNSLQPPSSLLSPSFFSSISASWAPVRNCTHASKAPSLHRTCQFCTLGIKYCNLGWRIWNITWTAEHNVVGLLQRTWEEARSTDHSSSHCLAPMVVMTTLVWRVVGIMIKAIMIMIMVGMIMITLMMISPPSRASQPSEWGLLL